MTLWLERKEKVQRHEKFIQWRIGQLVRISPRYQRVRRCEYLMVYTAYCHGVYLGRHDP